eukprot:IDg14075t1
MRVSEKLPSATVSPRSRRVSILSPLVAESAQFAITASRAAPAARAPAAKECTLRVVAASLAACIRFLPFWECPSKNDSCRLGPLSLVGCLLALALCFQIASLFMCAFLFQL